MDERELAAREEALRKKEQELEEREKRLDPLSMAVKAKQEQWYGKVKLSVKQLDIIIWITVGLLALVFLLMILESLGVYKLPW